MEGWTKRLVLLSVFALVSFPHLVTCQYTTCYSCTGSTSSTVCGYSTVTTTSYLSCIYGCMTQVTGSTSANAQMNRGCALSSSTNGCTYDSQTEEGTCTYACSASYCNGAVTNTEIDCYLCNSATSSYCETISTSTPTEICSTGSCLTVTTKTSSGSVVSVSRGCGAFPVPGSYNYDVGNGDYVYYTQCTSGYCNDVTESGSSAGTTTYGFQCYSCSGTSTGCSPTVSTSASSTSCTYGCSTMAQYTSGSLVTVTRGCALSKCTTSVCTSYGSTTYCTSTCTTSNCNNYISSSVPTITTCNKASLIEGNIISTMLCLLLVVIIALFY